MNKPLVLATVSLLCVGCDQSTKYIAQYYLQGSSGHSYLNDTFRLVYSENNGAFLGLGASLPEYIRTAIFSVLVAIFLLVFVIYVLKDAAITRTGIIASALIIGGGFSNLIDRWVNNGAVIDFLNIGIGSLRTGIFNVADMAIMLGLVLMVWFKPKAS